MVRNMLEQSKTLAHTRRCAWFTAMEGSLRSLYLLKRGISRRIILRRYWSRLLPHRPKARSRRRNNEPAGPYETVVLLKTTMSADWLTILNREVVACTRCPRLVTYREEVARVKRRAYRECEYWGKPVPGFGDPDAQVLIVGLAPGAHGSNRTGRPFTGDASGKFMYPVLYESGFANQGTATDREDGLELKNLYITAAVRCAPPDNKPLPQELAECSQFLDREIAGLGRLKVVVALGKIGFDACLNYVKRRGAIANKQGYLFKHGASYRLPDGKVLLASYHPSNQNTQTGKLTREMFLEIFKQAAKFADE
jgi:uracil-DNA glycosylase family 4